MLDKDLLNSEQADAFVGKGKQYLRTLRCIDNKRVAQGLDPRGPKYYKNRESGSVRYSKKELLEWMVNKTFMGMIEVG